MSHLITNAVYIPEDDIYLVSTHRHDFVCHKLRDGKEICVDGGTGPEGYGRRVGDLNELDDAKRYIEHCVMSDDPFERIAEMLLWGHRGKDGDQPLSYRPIKELAHRSDGINHLQAILDNCLNASPVHQRVIRYWLDILTSPRPARSPSTP